MVVGKLRKLGIVDPRIAVGDLMIRPALRAVRQRGRVTHDKPNLEQPRRVLVIAARLLRSRLRRIEAAPPGQATHAK